LHSTHFCWLVSQTGRPATVAQSPSFTQLPFDGIWQAPFVQTRLPPHWLVWRHSTHAL
jgi:hypothetical protein